jgi:4-hydroxy-3-methylbut-2-enyl diphosphate reductase
VAEILVATTAGFCFGVRRAVAQVERLAAERRQGRVVTLGPLIHNPQEVDRLRILGVVSVAESQILDGDRVVVRTHGLPLEQRRRIEAREVEIHDATCPYVRSAQTIAGRMAAAGYAVLLVGDAGHPETDSVVSAARDAATRASRPAPARVISSVVALGDPALGDTGRVAVLAQTTLEEERLRTLVSACVGRFVEVRAFNTICAATSARQSEARALAAQADLVLVVGGRDSANTRRLAEICAAIQPRTHQVEVAAELDRAWIAGANRVAVTAGASTPRLVIQDVVNRARELCQ